MRYPKIISINLTGKSIASGINHPDNYVVMGTIVYGRNDLQREGSFLMSVKNLTYHATSEYLTSENKDRIDIFELDKEEVFNLMSEEADQILH